MNNLDSLLPPKNSNDYVYKYKTGIILDELGIQDIYYYDRFEEEDEDGNIVQVKNFYYSSDRRAGVEISEFDYCVHYNQYFDKDEDKTKYNNPYQYFRIGRDSVHLDFLNKDDMFLFYKNRNEILRFSLDDFLKDVQQQSSSQRKHQYDPISPEKMIFNAGNDSVSIHFHFTNISGTISNSKTRINNMEAMLLIKSSTMRDTSSSP